MNSYKKAEAGEGEDKQVGSALAMPLAGIDPDWRERIELARRAYAEGKRLREGKPIMFRLSRPFPTTICPCLTPQAAARSPLHQ